MLWPQFRTIESLSFLHLFFAIFTVIPSVLQTKHLRTPSNMFVVNLAISDLGMMTTQAWKNWEKYCIVLINFYVKVHLFHVNRKTENISHEQIETRTCCKFFSRIFAAHVIYFYLCKWNYDKTKIFHAIRKHKPIYSILSIKLHGWAPLYFCNVLEYIWQTTGNFFIKLW